MKEKILIFLGSILLLSGIALVMCLPFAEEIQFWNARVGGVIGVSMITMGIAFIGMVAEERKR